MAYLFYMFLVCGLVKLCASDYKKIDSPCPSNFRYSYKTPPYAHISFFLKDEPDDISVMVKFSIPGGGNGIGGLQFLGDKEVKLKSGVKKRQLRYKIRLPTVKFLPRLTSLEVDGDVICKGPPYPSGVYSDLEMITLKDTVSKYADGETATKPTKKPSLEPEIIDNKPGRRRKPESSSEKPVTEETKDKPSRLPTMRPSLDSDSKSTTPLATALPSGEERYGDEPDSPFHKPPTIETETQDDVEPCEDETCKDPTIKKRKKTTKRPADRGDYDDDKYHHKKQKPGQIPETCEDETCNGATVPTDITDDDYGDAQWVQDDYYDEGDSKPSSVLKDRDDAVKPSRKPPVRKHDMKTTSKPETTSAESSSSREDGTVILFFF